VVRPAAFALCVMAAAGAACSGGGADGGNASAGGPSSSASAATTSAARAPTTSTTAVAADPYAIPEVIDAAYVNRVLAALYKVDGDAVREVLASRTVGAAAITKQSQIFSGDQLAIELRNLALVTTDDPSQYQSPPGDRRAIVDALVLATPTCIVALARSDFSDVIMAPAPDDPSGVEVVVMAPAPPAVRIIGINPTPWSITLARVIPRDVSPLEVAPCR